MKVVTAEEMRNIDSQTINEVGIPGAVLMENAGLGVVHAIVNDFPASEFNRVSIFVGKGNNGGDGLVVARHLIKRGYNVNIYILSESEKFSGDALINLQIAQKMNLPMQFILSEEQLTLHKDIISHSDIIVDSIFGTGLKGAVRGLAGDVIEFLNSTGIPIIAIDLPSGLDADFGKVEGACIRADLTVTMALPKRGLLLFPGAKYVGNLDVADIGIPDGIVDSQGIAVNLIQPSFASGLLPARPPDGHKGLFGRAFLLAGSVGLTGAATMASQSALRVGAGLVTLGIPKSLNPIMEVKLTEAMTVALAETEDHSIAMRASNKIMSLIENVDVIAIGPGLSRNSETSSLVRKLCREVKIPKVIDADGLNALADGKKVLKELGSNTVLTPHPGEMSRLIDRPISEIQADRINIAMDFAKENGVVLVLKGVPTVIATPDGEAYLNSTGNPGLASGGTGDVLTGAIAGFIAQGLSAKDAAILGVFVHGLAGDLVAEEKGNAGMIAGDVIEYLPLAIKQLALPC